MDIFLSAYACEPGKGSEPEVGWQVATGMARECRVRAVTRCNNREAIEEGIKDLEGPQPEFLYYDLPPVFLRLKKRFLGTSGYYVLWQIAVRWKFRKELQQADLIHHVTFNGVQFPGFWIGTGKPVVLGPLGGGMTCPEAMLPLFGTAQRKETLRTRLVGCLRFLPWWRLTISHATTVIAANRETAEVLQAHRRENVPVMLETAVLSKMISHGDRPARQTDIFRVLWLGQWIPRKAPVLALQALAIALESDPNIQLVFAGSGPEESRLRTETERLGITDKVDFRGRVPKEEVNALMDEADAFLFTSIRDTSGNVVLEAMSRAVPVATVWHQGMREICDEGSALLVEPTTPEATARGLATCLLRLKREDGLAERIGLAGKERLTHYFTWPAYISGMHDFYQDTLRLSHES